MKTFTDTRLLFHRVLLQIMRNPTWLFVGFSTPLLYLVLFTPLLRHLAVGGQAQDDVLNLFMPGILALLAFASGINSGFGTLFELNDGVIERFRVTAASRLALLMGPILAGGLMMFVFDAVLVGAGGLFGFDYHWDGLVVLAVLLILMMVTAACFSVATALMTKELTSFAAIINGMQLPILLLAGVLLPISLGPPWMKVLAHFNPLYYLVEASRVLADGTVESGKVLQAFAVLVPLCFLASAWATRVFRRAVS